ncbi:thiosulfate reductase PhsA [Shewanella sp. MBTL60-007]|uniref:thiosulfate reductase PhsA n=1 Tax=Shewanella sp. MBTL60-007 TaxID=2815911 RepID=UPI001BC6F25B|nr:thiosulfate reductase PhsA [Shewanella sp. MBTL60-007]GIU16036.1 thiosulfate reductase [Shewanella sp. MBTL60-007]
MLSRRDFLAKGSAFCAITVYAPGTLGAQSKILTPATPFIKEINSICEMCSTRCPITVESRLDKLFIRGNLNAKSFGGKVCARGTSGSKLLYDPHRLVKPIKRTGPRGSGQWQEIEWEEAYQLIADNLNQVRDQYGPEAIAVSSKSGSLSNHAFHFGKAIGTPNIFSHGSTCPISYAVAARVMFGNELKLDLENSKYILNFGHNLYEGVNMSMTRALLAAQEKGTVKVVVFEPRLSVMADKADEWHAIKPGTDIAVVLALSHVLIEEQLYDKSFVQQYVSGFEDFSASMAQYSPEWASEVCGISAGDIRRIARELAAAAPAAIADHGHRCTFTPEEFDLRRGIYAINVLLGNIERKGGVYFAKNSKLYNKLAGKVVAPSLEKIKVEGLPTPVLPRIDLADPQFKYAAKAGGLYHSIIPAALLQHPYAIKAWVMSRSNPMQTVTDRSQVQKAFEAMDFVVACDVYISESAAYADVVLPESTYLERDEDISDYSAKNPAYALRQRVTDTIGDTRPSWQIFKEMADAMSLGHYFPWRDISDYQQRQVKTNPELLSQLKGDGFLSFGVPLLMREPEMVAKFCQNYPNALPVSERGDYGHQLQFMTPSGKIELSSPSIEKIAPGRSVIRYRPVVLKQRGELYFIQGKSALHTNAATQNIPLLYDLQPDNPVWIHPDTAAELGINDGEAIFITSLVGEEQGTAKVTPGIRKDTVFAHMGFGSKNQELTRAFGKGVHCGALLPHATAAITGSNIHTTGVTIRPV